MANNQVTLPYGSKVDDFEILHDQNITIADLPFIKKVNAYYEHNNVWSNSHIKIFETNLRVTSDVMQFYEFNLINIGATDDTFTEDFNMYVKVAAVGGKPKKTITAINNSKNIEIPKLTVIEKVENNNYNIKIFLEGAKYSRYVVQPIIVSANYTINDILPDGSTIYSNADLERLAEGGTVSYVDSANRIKGDLEITGDITGDLTFQKDIRVKGTGTINKMVFASMEPLYKGATIGKQTPVRELHVANLFKAPYLSSTLGTFPEDAVNGTIVIDSYSKKPTCFCEHDWYCDGVKVLTIKSISLPENIDVNNYPKNTILEITVNMCGEDGNYSYKLEVKDNASGNIFSRDYQSGSNVLTWTPTSSGTKTVTVYAKSDNPLYKDLTVKRSFEITIV